MKHTQIMTVLSESCDGGAALTWWTVLSLSWSRIPSQHLQRLPPALCPRWLVTSTTSTKLVVGACCPSPTKDVWQTSPDWCLWWVWFKGVRRQIKPNGKLETWQGSGVGALPEELKKAWRIFVAVKPRSWAAEQTVWLKARCPYLTRRGLKWKGLPGSDFLLL